MSKRTGRKSKRERTSRRRTRRHSSTSESSSEDVPPPKAAKSTRATSKVNEVDKKVALTIKLPKPESNECGEENTIGMWKVECSNGSDGDIQKLKISLRRSPKDLLREQAAEEKRKEKEEAAGSSMNTSTLDGSVTNYLEQFGDTMTVEKTEQNIVESNEQAQVVILTTNEPSCKQDNISQIESDPIDNSEKSSELITPQEKPIVENISTNDKLTEEVISEIVVETNVISGEITESSVAVTVDSITQINSSENIPDVAVHPSIEEFKIMEPILEDKSVNVTEVVSSNISKIKSSDIDIPITSCEKIQNDEPESVEIQVNESNISEENVTIANSETINDPIEESDKTDVINDLEQMEDVVQLTVESPDLVDDEDPKPVDGEECIKLVEEEESKIIDEEKIKPFKELSSDITNLNQITDEKELKLDETQITFETPKSLSSHPKRKWGSCKTRTPITIIPFTLGAIIESNGDSIGDNGEYRSEEGEIQRTDSEEEQDVDEQMEINDTMLIDHEAVDYEAPEDDEKPDIDNDETKSDKSLAEEVINVEPKKILSVKRLATTSVIRITNLVRPFTVGQLRDLLQRTGKITSNGFWIDKIKSQCIVEYENEEQAIETVYALNESQWPSTNPKFLRVVFTDKEELNKALNGTCPDRLIKQKESKVEKLRTQLDNHIILREWDRGKLEDINGEKDDKLIKRKISNEPHVIKDKKIKKDLQDKRRKSKTKTPERIPTKSLDELFRKTKTTPTLYWSPLSTEQIAEKEDQRRKHLAEIERSQKTDRRRRGDVNNFPRRR